MFPAAPAWAAPPPPLSDAPTPRPVELEQAIETNEAVRPHRAVAAGQRLRIMTTETISVRRHGGARKASTAGQAHRLRANASSDRSHFVGLSGIRPPALSLGCLAHRHSGLEFSNPAARCIQL